MDATKMESTKKGEKVREESMCVCAESNFSWSLGTPKAGAKSYKALSPRLVV